MLLHSPVRSCRAHCALRPLITVLLHNGGRTNDVFIGRCPVASSLRVCVCLCLSDVERLMSIAVRLLGGTLESAGDRPRHSLVDGEQMSVPWDAHYAAAAAAGRETTSREITTSGNRRRPINPNDSFCLRPV